MMILNFRTFLNENSAAVVVLHDIVADHHMLRHAVEVDTVREIVVKIAVGNQHLAARRLRPDAAVRAATVYISDHDRRPRAVEVDISQARTIRRDCQVLDQRVVAAIARDAVRRPARARVAPARDADEADARADLDQRAAAALAAQARCGEVPVRRA